MKSALIVLAVAAAVLVAGCTGNLQDGNDDGGNDNKNNATYLDSLKLGNVTLSWLGHSSFVAEGSRTAYIDPFVLQENATKADYILATHDHFDHCAINNMNSLKKDSTRLFSVLDCVSKLRGRTNSMKPGEFFQYADGVRIESVESYNTDKFKSPGQLYHPRGSGIGFILTMDGIKIYHAGDTDFIQEMNGLKNQSIDVAILPIGGVTAMDAAEAAEAARAISPRYVVPMHYNSGAYGIEGMDADPRELARLLDGTGIEVAVLKPLVSG